MAKKDFRFYAPLTLEKAKDDNDKEVMKLSGIASTIDEDSDGEFLDPNGFVLDDFLSVGFVNWHHQAKNKPKTIVGEPSLAEIRPEGLYVECILYPSSEIAKEIYEVAEILEKDSQTRKLGFSIEGEVLERESEDKKNAGYKKIRKASITGLAITHMPKNGKTFAQILKAMQSGDDIGSESADESEDSSGLDTKSGKVLIKESVDKNLKNLQKRKIKKSKFEIIELGEEQMYDLIFKSFEDISVDDSERVFSLLTQIKQAMTKGKIDDEKLEKAMSILGLKSNNVNPFLKAKDENSDEEETEEEETENEEESEEEIDKKVQKRVEETYSKVPYKKNVEKGGYKKAAEPEKVEKSNIVDEYDENTLIKSIREITKSGSVENKALGVLIQSVITDNQILKAQSEKSEKFLRHQSELLESQTEIIKGLTGRLEEVLSEPTQRKSVTRYNERFVEKAENTRDGKMLSKSKDRNAIINLLDNKTFEKGFNSEFSKATTSFEASGNLSGNILKALEADGIVIVD